MALIRHFGLFDLSMLPSPLSITPFTFSHTGFAFLNSAHFFEGLKDQLFIYVFFT